MLRYGSRSDVRLFKRANGYDETKRVRYGIVGGCDIHGWLSTGRAVEIEVKVGRDKLRPEQEAFRDTALRFGVLWIEARSVEDVERAL